jgi:hypothetical protein
MRTIALFSVLLMGTMCLAQISQWSTTINFPNECNVAVTETITFVPTSSKYFIRAIPFSGYLTSGPVVTNLIASSLSTNATVTTTALNTTSTARTLYVYYSTVTTQPITITLSYTVQGPLYDT